MRIRIERRPPHDCAVALGDDYRVATRMSRPPFLDGRVILRVLIEGRNAVLDPFIVNATDCPEIVRRRAANCDRAAHRTGVPRPWEGVRLLAPKSRP